MDIAQLGIQVTVTGAEEALRKLREIEKAGKSIRANIDVKIQTEELSRASREISSLERKTRSLEDRIKSLQKVDLIALNTEQLRAFRSELSRVNNSLFRMRETLSKEDYNRFANQIQKLSDSYRELVEGQKELLLERERSEREYKKFLQEQQKVAESYTYADAAAQEYHRTLRQKVAESYAYADAEAKEYHKTLARLGLSYDEIGNRIRKVGLSVERLKLEKDFSAVRDRSKEINREILFLENELRKIGRTRNVTEFAKNLRIVRNELDRTVRSFSFLNRLSSVFVAWWKRFGLVGIGFTTIYQTMNALQYLASQFVSTLITGVKESGELVALQSKLAMWIGYYTRSPENVVRAFGALRDYVNEVMNVSLTTASNIREITTAIDELGQAGVFIRQEMLPAFGDLVDFTKMVAETTGSTTRQIRQEFQALMQGEVRVTNILIKTAKALGILNDEEIKNLKLMKNRQEVAERLITSVHEYYSKIRENLLRADVSLAFEKWHAGVRGIIRQATILASRREGVLNIFGEVLYKHIQDLKKVITEMKPEDYSEAILLLAKVFDIFLTSVERVTTELLDLADVAGTVGRSIKEISDSIQELTGISGFEIVKQGILGRLLFGNWRMAAIPVVIDLIIAKMREFRQESKFLKVFADTFNDGLIVWTLFKSRPKIAAALTFFDMVLRTLITYKREIKDFLGIETKREGLEREIEKYRKLVEEEKKTIEAYKSDPALAGYAVSHEKRLKYYEERLNKLIEEKNKLEEITRQTSEEKAKKELNYLEELLQKNNKLFALSIERKELESEYSKILDSIIPKEEKLKNFYDEVLTKLINADLLTPTQAFKAFIIEASKLYNIKSEVDYLEEGLKSLGIKTIPKTKDEIIRFINAIIRIDEARQKQEELNKTLEKTKERLLSITDPTLKFSENFDILVKTIDKYKLSSDVFIAGLVDISKSIVDVNGHEETLIKLLKESGIQLDNLSKEKAISLIKSLAEQARQIDELNNKIEDYKQQLEELIDPTKTIREQYEILLKTLEKYPEYGITGYIAGIKELASKIIDISDHEETFNKLLVAQADILRKLPIDDVINKIKELAKEAERIDRQDWFGGLKKGLEDYLDSITDVSQQMHDLVVNAFQGMENALVEFVTTGKLEFKSLVDSIISDLARLFVRRYITAPLTQSLYGSLGNISFQSGIPTYNFGGGFFNTTLPYTDQSIQVVDYATGQIYTINTGGLSLGQALGYGGLAGIGYTTIGSLLGLPQSQYSGLTASAGGALGSWAGSALIGGSWGGPVGAAVGGILGGIFGSLFGNDKPDNSWFYVFTGQRPPAPVDYTVSSPFGTLYMPAKGYDLNDIGFDTAQRKQFERDFLNRIAELDRTFAEAVGDTYIQAIRDYLKGSQRSWEWQTDKQEEFEEVIRQFLRERYSRVFSAIDERILRYFSESEDIQQALPNLAQGLVYFTKLSDQTKELILTLPDEILQQFEEAGYTYSQIFQSLSQNFANIQDLVDKVAFYMSNTNETLVEAYENVVKQWNDINKFVVNIFSNLKITENIDEIKENIESNIREQFGQVIIKSYIDSITKSITDSLFNYFGVTSFSELFENISAGQLSVDDLKNTLSQIYQTVDEQADPKLRELIDTLKELGLISEDVTNKFENFVKTLEWKWKTIGLSQFEIVNTYMEQINNVLGTSFSTIDLMNYISNEIANSITQGNLNELLNQWHDTLVNFGMSSEEATDFIQNFTNAITDLRIELYRTAKSIEDNLLGMIQNARPTLHTWQGGTASEFWMWEAADFWYQYGDRALQDPELLRKAFSLISNYYQSLISEIEEEHQKWEDLSKRAEDLVNRFRDRLTPQANVLDSIPVLIGESIDNVENFIENTNEWLNRAFQLRENIENIRQSIQGTILSIQRQAELYNLTPQEQINYYTRLINQKLGNMGRSPERDLELAKEIQQLVQERWNLELNSIQKLKDEIKGIDSIIEDIGRTINNIIIGQGSAYSIYYQIKQAEKTYIDLLQRARSGRPEDIQAYLSYVSQYLDVQRRGSATSREYLQIQYRVQKDLNSLKDVSQEQKTTLENQISNLNNYANQANNILERVDEILGNQYDVLTGAIQDSLTNIENLLGENGAIRKGLDNTAEKLSEVIDQLGYFADKMASIQYNIQMRTFQTITREVLRPYYSYYHYSDFFRAGDFSRYHSVTSEHRGYREYSLTERHRLTTEATMTPTAMAEGGIATKPTNVIFGEAGDEAILPLHEGPNTLEIMHNDIKEAKAFYRELIHEIRELRAELRIADHEKVKTLKKLFRIEDRRDKYGMKVVTS